MNPINDKAPWSSLAPTLIAKELNVQVGLENYESMAAEPEWRINFIRNALKNAGCTTLVLGISGGVDSLLAGRLCQLAVESLRKDGYAAEFIAMRLPYKQQRDKADVELALDFIKPDKIVTMNIGDSVDAMMVATPLLSEVDGTSMGDFIKGNIKARARMVAQYAVANATNGLVVGTDHAAEAVMGFFTKHGDGACDLAPLTGLVKGQVRRMAEFLGAPDALVNKTPTADLEDLDPGKPDEVAYGCTYEQIDSFLLGKAVPDEISERIKKQYWMTRHKRTTPYTPFLPS